MIKNGLTILPLNNNRMRSEILNNLDNPKQLEKLYRDNKVIFKKSLTKFIPDIKRIRP